MEDNLTIKRVRITKLNSSNYRIQAVITRAIIKAKDTYNAIKQLDLEAKTPIKSIDKRIVEGKAIALGKAINIKANCIIDIKARTIIIAYYRLEALSKVLCLQTAKEQWETLERSYLPIGR